MKGMLKAEQFKFRNSYALWIIIGVITVSCFISIVMGTYNSAEQTLLNITKDSMVPLLACAIYGAVILTDDFSNGLLRHYIAGGYRRISILFAKLIHYLFGCSVLLLVYPCLCVSLAAALHGTETTFPMVVRQVIFAFFRTLPLYLGIFGLFFLIAVLIKRGVVVAGTSVVTSILLVVFTDKLYGSAASILKFSPIIQIGEVASGKVTGIYFASVLVSFAVLAVCALGSILKFNRDEL